MLNVLIVEDSPVVQQLLQHILGSDPDIHIAGIADSGEAALGMLSFCKPDVITMDMHLPGMDGLETTRRIMESHPLPIVIVSASWQPELVEKTFAAMQAGALVAVEKPVGLGQPDHQAVAARLVQTVKLMAEIKVVRRRPRPPAAPAPPVARVRPATLVKVVAIGASTGGPPVLHGILARLRQPFPIPLLIVQHILDGFALGLAEWLHEQTGFPVHVAAHHEALVRGQAYVAPDAYHVGVTADGRIALSEAPPENALRPSVSYLLRSVASVFGSAAVGILLTGMGKDGAKELRLMKNAGALTIVQDRESSVVHGMPGEAIALGAATWVLPPEGIADTLNQLVVGESVSERTVNDGRG